MIINLSNITSLLDVDWSAYVQFDQVIEKLDISCNPIGSLQGLPRNPIKELICNRCNLSSLEELPDGIESLTCVHNNLTDLRGLSSTIKKLCCHSNRITSLVGLPEGLIEINCGSNLLQNLVGLPESIKFADCTFNPINSLLSLPAGIEDLRCYSTRLTSLTGRKNKIINTLLWQERFDEYSTSETSSNINSSLL